MSDQRESEATRLAEERGEARANLNAANIVYHYGPDPHWKVTANTTASVDGVPHTASTVTEHATRIAALNHVASLGGPQ